MKITNLNELKEMLRKNKNFLKLNEGENIDTIEEIYRVVCTDQYQSTTPETCWTTNKQSCEEYIANSYYKHCLSIETSRMSDIAVKL